MRKGLYPLEVLQASTFNSVIFSYTDSEDVTGKNDYWQHAKYANN